MAIASPRALATPKRALTVTALVVAPALALAGLVVGATSVDAAALPTNLRLTPAARQMHQAGHTWVSDRHFARGGHIGSTRSAHSSEHHKGMPVRSGPFTYTLHVAPGTYSVRVDVIDASRTALARRSLPMSTSPAAYSRTAKKTQRVDGHSASQFSWTTRTTSGKLTMQFRSSCRVINLVALRKAPIIRHIRPTPPKAMPTKPSPSPTAPATTAPATTAPATTAPATTAPSSTAPSTTAGATTPASSSAPAGSITPEQFGAAGNGTTDDTAALQRAFDQANGRIVYLPAGHVYAHNNVLHLRVAALHVTGPGELLATNEAYSSVWVEADNVTLDGGMLIKTSTTTKRWTTWQQMGVRIAGHSGATLRNITVDGSAAAGIYVGGMAHDFVIDHVTVQNTRADGIHMTDGSYNGQVIAPLVRLSGDDAVAVVSYKNDGVICHDITVTSPTVRVTTGGRGLSVVGGQNITETNIDVQGSSAASVYVAAEGSPWYTAAPTNITFTGGQITDANAMTNDNHGAVVVYSGESDVAPSHVTVSNMTISNTRSTACRDFGVVQDGTAPSSIMFSNLTITGGPKLAYQGNAAQSTFQTRNISLNGKLLANLG